MGALEKIPVGISGTSYSPLQIPTANRRKFSVFLQKSQSIPDPFEQFCLFWFLYLYIQPFEDINKRTSRIACNILFLTSKWFRFPLKCWSIGIFKVYFVSMSTMILQRWRAFIESYLSSTKGVFEFKVYDGYTITSTDSISSTNQKLYTIV